MVVVEVPPAPPPPTFTGCYVNGGAGYGLWNIDHFSNPDTFGDFTQTTTSGGRGWLGTVGGGCVEAEVWAEAREAMRDGKSGLHHFSLTADEASEDSNGCQFSK